MNNIVLVVLAVFPVTAHGRVGASAKSGAFSHCGRRGSSRSSRERTAALSN